jgi:serine/threonine-protein kinase RsbT
MSAAYENTLFVLSRYLSRVNAKLTLERALRRIELTPENFDNSHIEILKPHLERSLALFVERARLPHLLAALGERQVPKGLSERGLQVANEMDLTEARIQARQVCQDIGAPKLTTQKVATLVSELARNIVLYAQPGRIEIAPHLEPRKRIVIRASDSGPGIANLEQILAGDYKSKTGLGMGLRGCKRLADKFVIDTGAWGTKIEAEVHV